MSEQELEEIIRQAYFIGIKDAEDKHPAVADQFRHQRVKQIVSCINQQRNKGPLVPFYYEKLKPK